MEDTYMMYRISTYRECYETYEEAVAVQQAIAECNGMTDEEVAEELEIWEDIGA